MQNEVFPILQRWNQFLESWLDLEKSKNLVKADLNPIYENMKWKAEIETIRIRNLTTMQWKSEYQK